MRARRTGAVLPCQGYQVVESALFKPMTKPLSVIHAKDKVQSFETVRQVRSVKGPGAPSVVAPVIKEIAPKRQRGDDGVDIPVDFEEMDVEGEQDKALRQFMMPTV